MPKQSSISPRNAPDWRPTLLLDQTQSAELLADLLKAAKWKIALHSEVFPGNGSLADHVWIPQAVAQIEDCAIISSDRSMKLWTTENGFTRPAIEQCCGKVFFLSSTSMATKRTLGEQAAAIIKAQKEICRLYRRHAETYCFSRIHMANRAGEVQMLYAGSKRQRYRKEDVA